jgi:acetoin utilization deacetylase AcuC-like enzyme
MMLTVFSQDHLRRNEAACAAADVAFTGADLLHKGAKQRALTRIGHYRNDALVVSLGVDTFAEDPISSFRLRSVDFTAYGRMIGA